MPNDIPAAPAAAPVVAPAAPAAAAPAPAAVAAPAAAPGGTLVGDATIEAPAFDASAARAYLTEKGSKADELAALDEAALKAKFDEAKANEGKPADVKAEDIEVKIPEGVTVDEKQMGEFKSVLADAKLSPTERAQKLADMHLAALKAQAEGPTKFWQDTQKKWVDEINADPEIGTTNLETRNKVFAEALRSYGVQYGADAEKGLREALAMTGAGNNPHIARMIFSAWKDRIEGGPLVGKPADSEGTYKKAVNSMYPTANPVA